MRTALVYVLGAGMSALEGADIVVFLAQGKEVCPFTTSVFVFVGRRKRQEAGKYFYKVFQDLFENLRKLCAKPAVYWSLHESLSVCRIFIEDLWV